MCTRSWCFNPVCGCRRTNDNGAISYSARKISTHRYFISDSGKPPFAGLTQRLTEEARTSQAVRAALPPGPSSATGRACAPLPLGGAWTRTRPSSKFSEASINPSFSFVGKLLASPWTTNARYDLSMARARNCCESSRAKALVRARTRTPVVPCDRPQNSSVNLNNDSGDCCI